MLPDFTIIEMGHFSISSTVEYTSKGTDADAGRQTDKHTHTEGRGGGEGLLSDDQRSCHLTYQNDSLEFLVLEEFQILTLTRCEQIHD